MLDIRFVRENLEIVARAMETKGEQADLDELQQLDERRRKLLQETETLKHQRNTVSKEIGLLKKAGKETGEIMEKMRLSNERMRKLDEEIRQLDERLEAILLSIPNLPDPEVPIGAQEEDNVEVRRWGEHPNFDFAPKAHWDVGTDLGILDFACAGKITGARFALYRGDGARLERALINFMLDLHTEEHGYQEIFPPFMVNSKSMQGTGQLPKFAEDAFHVEGTDYWLIPTAEVPVTNIHRDEILEKDELPRYYVAYSACFRAEAGAHGRDTRGLIRQHQFNKVELVKFTAPEDSSEELEKLVANAEKVLQLLGLPYRVMLMCSGDLGFSAAKKYDLELWMPSYDTYREVSSCSNFRDFQARRAGIRFRAGRGSKAEFAHTLNGSGVAIGRTVAAILENFQQADGSVIIPQVLRRYFPASHPGVILPVR
ncbi:MAG TPA: serine--tRNA ligase [Firmicutes bacterium]|jgi:seryl-tRNA synthetase|nr:serine--tRNA ligase [Bacillota bacterium]